MDCSQTTYQWLVGPYYVTIERNSSKIEKTTIEKKSDYDVFKLFVPLKYEHTHKYACTHIYLYIYTYMHVGTHVYTGTHLHTYTHINTYT